MMWPPLQFTNACAVIDAAISLFSPQVASRKRPVGAKEKGPKRFGQGAGLVYSCVARYSFEKQDVVIRLKTPLFF